MPHREAGSYRQRTKKLPSKTLSHVDGGAQATCTAASTVGHPQPHNRHRTSRVRYGTVESNSRTQQYRVLYTRWVRASGWRPTTRWSHCSRCTAAVSAPAATPDPSHPPAAAPAALALRSSSVAKMSPRSDSTSCQQRRGRHVKRTPYNIDCDQRCCGCQVSETTKCSARYMPQPPLPSRAGNCQRLQRSKKIAPVA